MTIHETRDYLQNASADGHRTTVLRPIQWLLTILISGFALSVATGAPVWWLYVIGIGTGLIILLFLVAYCFSLFTNPDLLRSEKYSLRKMEIEHSLMGDNEYGLIDMNTDSSMTNRSLMENAESKEGDNA